MQIIAVILKDVLTALYQFFFPSIILTFLGSFFYLHCAASMETGTGARAAFSAWKRAFLTSLTFRRVTALAFFLSMILFRTLLGRSVTANPLKTVIGNFGIWVTNAKGVRSLTTEGVENIFLTMPFLLFLLLAFENRFMKGKTLGTVLLKSVKIAFLLSLAIECLQLLLHLGYFQLSDLFHNTLGGFLGGLIAWTYARLKKGKR
ncbi:MAG: VanZ family protein [Clostridia bacterium]|nr:VanZ family protein [Clostridia bacterium]MBR0407795.1 VanZ family protein [Clostridia bacterium]